MGSHNLSQKIADFTLNLKYEDIPPDVVAYAKLLMMDSLGVSLACLGQPHAEQIFRVLSQKRAVPEASLWGSRTKVEMDDAVLYNGSLIHGLDYDDTNGHGIVHPSSSVVTCGLTVGEALGKSGKEIITAIIVGYEVLLRIAGFTNGRLHDRGFHPTGCCNAFSSACIAGKLMGVTREQLLNTLGMCGSQAAAILEFLRDGTDIKKLHPGWGVHCALYDLAFAKAGFTGPIEVLEGQQGYFLAHIGTIEGVDEYFDDFGKRWWTKEIAFKFYPVCHWLHGFNDILRDMEREHGFGADDIEILEPIIDERVERVGYATPDKLRPATAYHQRFSLFYTMAMFAYKGRLGPKEIDEKHMQDQGLLDMIDRVKVTVDPAAYVPGHFSAQLRVHLKDGRCFFGSQPYEKGSPENPATREDVLRKYYENAVDVVGQEQADEIIGHVDHIEDMDTVDRLIGAMVKA